MISIGDNLVMMIFLIGGTGNQIFQLRSQFDVYSCFFLKPSITGLLGWSKHPYVLKGLRSPSFLWVFTCLLFLVIDLAMLWLGCKPIFGQIDLRHAKGEGRLKIYAIGYFQSNDKLNDFRASILSESFNFNDQAENVPVVFHIRGGDVLSLGNIGKNAYGVLPPTYYYEALSNLSDTEISDAYIITNDSAYAKSIFGSAAKIAGGTLIEDFRLGVFSSRYISSSSTLSFWIVRCREYRKLKSVVPYPFSKSHHFSFASETKQLNVSY